MSAYRRAATGAVAAFAIVLAAPAVGADAATGPRHFETLASVNGGHVQACRIPTRPSKPILIKVRVDATKASGRVSGVAQATKNGNAAGNAWKSGWVRKGTRSDVGTVRVARGTAFELMAGIGAGQMGDGGSFKARTIRTCR